MLVEALVGTVLSHVSHLLSTLLLYLLAFRLLPIGQGKAATGPSTPLVAACLYIASPAGIFLSAPYIEAPFATLQFLGTLSCVEAWREEEQDGILGKKCLLTIIGGACFGLSSTFRSNGLLSLLVFLAPCLSAVKQFLRKPVDVNNITYGVSLAIACLLTLAGTVGPQYIAYEAYCSQPRDQSLRPWCDRLLPSIYSFVQDHYWCVAYFTY